MGKRSFPKAISFGLVFAIVSHLSMNAYALIDNGLEAEAGEWPDVVEVADRCTGSIVGNDTILTAAHCLKDVDPNRPDISILVPGLGSFEVVSVFSHPHWLWRPSASGAEFRALESHDIAVLRVKTRNAFAHHIPVRFLSSSADLIGASVSMIGYGDNDATVQFNRGWGVKRKGSNRIIGVTRLC